MSAGFADALFGKRSPIDEMPGQVRSGSQPKPQSPGRPLPLLQASGSEAAPGAEEVGSRASEPVEAADSRGGSATSRAAPTPTPPPHGPMDDNSLESGE